MLPTVQDVQQQGEFLRKQGIEVGGVVAEQRERLGIGIEHVYSAVHPTVGVISVTPDLTVWTDGRTLRWSRDGTPDDCPAADLEAAAERLATLADPADSSPAQKTETE
jgi:hypothetical protein